MSSNASTYSPEIQKKIVDILAKILTKANEDEAFGELCLQDFDAAFEQLIGSPMPEGAQFACERQGGRIMLKTPQDGSGELEETDLEEVAGGFGGVLDPILDPLRQFLSGPNPNPMPGAPAYGAPISWANLKVDS